MNEIATTIHLYCAKVYGTPYLYTDNPTKFR